MDVQIRRNYLSKGFKVNDWAEIAPYFAELKSREFRSKEELETWLKDLSELEAAIQEEMGRRYINMTRYTDNQIYRDSFNHMIEEIEPKVSPLINELNQKLINSPYSRLLTGNGYEILLRGVRNEIELFREENIPLQTKIQSLQSKYGEITGGLSIEYNGKELTLQQASLLLMSEDRKLREEIFNKIQEARLSVEEKLDDLFDEMVPLRHQMALNAGFENFRDYMFSVKGRFDYTAEDCKQFHEAVLKKVVPLLDDIEEDRKNKLALEVLRPWDLRVDKYGRAPLKPFKDSKELIEKSVKLFSKLDTYFAQCLETMDEIGHLDLESRKNKAPGGYNYPLDEVGVPFIFMNATSTFRDMITLMHEGGHAVHSFLTKDLDLLPFKHPTSEVAELASMSMELLTMDYWNEFFTEKEDLSRAKEEHLEQIIETLPWVAVIDKFQHWIYENPTHSRNERRNKWMEIFDAYRSKIVDYTDLEDVKRSAWQRQLHIFEVPFYYIEYAIAQLGAIGIWKNYRENPRESMENYKKGLSLGYTRKIPEIYSIAGVEFNFTSEHIEALSEYINKEINECRKELS